MRPTALVLVFDFTLGPLWEASTIVFVFVAVFPGLARR